MRLADDGLAAPEVHLSPRQALLQTGREGARAEPASHRGPFETFALSCTFARFVQRWASPGFYITDVPLGANPRGPSPCGARAGGQGCNAPPHRCVRLCLLPTVWCVWHLRPRSKFSCALRDLLETIRVVAALLQPSKQHLHCAGRAPTLLANPWHVCDRYPLHRTRHFLALAAPRGHTSRAAFDKGAFLKPYVRAALPRPRPCVFAGCWLRLISTGLTASSGPGLRYACAETTAP